MVVDGRFPVSCHDLGTLPAMPFELLFYLSRVLVSTLRPDTPRRKPLGRLHSRAVQEHATLAAVVFHENFWVATSAVAPVIALAAVVALTDTMTILGRVSVVESAVQQNPNHDSWIQDRLAGTARDSRKWTLIAGLITLINLIIQAALLAVSLSALAYDQDIMPLWLAVTLATGGILLLAWGTFLSALQRWNLDSGVFRKGNPFDPETTSGDSTDNQS
jgi:hypothetical protein